MVASTWLPPTVFYLYSILNPVVTWWRSRSVSGLPHPPPPNPPLQPRPLVYPLFDRPAPITSCEICSIPAPRAPTPCPPRNRSPWTPPSPQLFGRFLQDFQKNEKPVPPPKPLPPLLNCQPRNPPNPPLQPSLFEG